MSDLKNIVDNISKYLIEQDKKLAFAESCTGGLLSSKITARAGASKFFLGSVISYAGSVKMSILGVPLQELETAGEVSQSVARLMADGVRRKMNSDWALAITGYAGPETGSSNLPVGLVCFSVVGPKFVHCEEKIIKGNKREEIQEAAADYGLQILWNSFQS